MKEASALDLNKYVCAMEMRGGEGECKGEFEGEGESGCAHGDE